MDKPKPEPATTKRLHGMREAPLAGVPEDVAPKQPSVRPAKLCKQESASFLSIKPRQ